MTRTPRPLEKEVQAQVLAWLRLHGGLPIRVNSGALPWRDTKGMRRLCRLNSEPGCSDVLCCWRGRFLAVECKRPGEKPTPEQESFLELVRRKGGVAIVAHGVEDLELVLLPELGRDR